VQAAGESVQVPDGAHRQRQGRQCCKTLQHFVEKKLLFKYKRLVSDLHHQFATICCKFVRSGLSSGMSFSAILSYQISFQVVTKKIRGLACSVHMISVCNPHNAFLPITETVSNWGRFETHH
jgi:hypothetical protein